MRNIISLLEEIPKKHMEYRRFFLHRCHARLFFICLEYFWKSNNKSNAEYEEKAN